MRILLINACLRHNASVKYIPVGLSCIATALDRAGFRPDILDIDLYRYTNEEIDNFLKKNNFYSIIAFGNIVSGYRYTKKLARQIKRAIPEALLVVGNTVATAMPELLLKCVPEIDIAVIGEGDIAIVEIARERQKKNGYSNVRGIAYRSSGKIVLTERREAIPCMNDIPFPDYSLFEVEKYLSVSKKGVQEPLPPVPFEEIRALPFNVARGCPFSCTFCSHAFKGDKYRYYPFEAVVKHIKNLQKKYNINYIHFWDELTFFSAERLSELCDSIEKEKANFYWTLDTRSDVFARKDLDLLKRSRRLGALVLSSALESSDLGILKAMNKRISIEGYIEQVETAKEAGLGIATYLVIGYPQETTETIKKTFDLCRRLEIYPSVGFLLPLPGAPIYNYAREKDYIKNEEEYLLRIGDRQDLHINLTGMPDELMIDTVKEELVGLRDELNIQLDDDKIIKTRVYKVSRKGQ